MLDANRWAQIHYPKRMNEEAEKIRWLCANWRREVIDALAEYGVEDRSPVVRICKVAGDEGDAETRLEHDNNVRKMHEIIMLAGGITEDVNTESFAEGVVDAVIAEGTEDAVMLVRGAVSHWSNTQDNTREGTLSDTFRPKRST
jgi:hypothetical protein